MARGVCALADHDQSASSRTSEKRDWSRHYTPEEAAELNKCFLRDTAVAISSACSRRPVGDEGRMDLET